MEEKIVMIINEMADYLNVSQMKKLQEVLLQTFSENTIQKEETSNDEYLQLFLDAKRIEGCSERTIQYYSATVARLLQIIKTPVRKIMISSQSIEHDKYKKSCSLIGGFSYGKKINIFSRI